MTKFSNLAFLNCFSSLISHYAHLIILDFRYNVHSLFCRSILDLFPHASGILSVFIYASYSYTYFEASLNPLFLKEKKPHTSWQLAFSGHFLFFEFLHFCLSSDY